MGKSKYVELATKRCIVVLLKVFYNGKLALHLSIVPTCILSLLTVLGDDWFRNV